MQFSYCSRFGPRESLDAIAMTVIGGLGSVLGPVLGAAYVLGLPTLFDSSATVVLLTSSIGLLVLLLYFPGGLVRIFHRLGDAIVGWLSRSSAIEVEPPARRQARPRPLVERQPFEGEIALRTSEVSVRFGGVVALDRVSVEVRRGEIVGLIGTNGAGKSTLMNVVSGFITPAQGDIEILGRDATSLPVHRRASIGMGRLFQDARLFPDLTVREAVQVALESTLPVGLWRVAFGTPHARRAERAKAENAAEYIDFLGLGRYADHNIGELSTGTRRIVESTCFVAQGPQLLLLDEPTAGVAQRETEAFGPLIERIQRELGASMLIIEHDMPLVMSISDRVYCLSSGRPDRRRGAGRRACRSGRDLGVPRN